MAKNNQSAGNVSPEEIQSLISIKAQDPQETAGALSLLTALAKKKEPRRLIREGIAPHQLDRLLASSDAKIRKNTARLTGELYRQENLTDQEKASLADAIKSLAARLRKLLETEETQFVRPSYILSIGALGEGKLLEDYRIPEDTLEKFAAEEKQALRKALPPQPQTLHTLHHLPARELMLSTALGWKKVPAAAWGKLQQDRTWLEMLVPLKGPREILPLLEETLSGEGPFRYRLEYRIGNMTARVDRPKRIRQLIQQISSAAGEEKLVNDPSLYEVEIRVEESDQKERWSLKYYCAEDSRFAYRRQAIPASIHPANAARVIRLAVPYVKAAREKNTARENNAALEQNAAGEKPVVLDPCCGSGTLLMERAQAGPCFLMGVDIERRAIRAAQENLKSLDPDSWKLYLADLGRWQMPEGVKADEIYANLPFGIRVGDHGENEKLYHALVQQLPRWLKEGGTAVIYTVEGRLLEKELSAESRLKLRKQFRLKAGGLEPKLYIIGID